MSATNARNSPSLLPRLLFDKICAITTAKTDTANDSRRPPPPPPATHALPSLETFKSLLDLRHEATFHLRPSSPSFHYPHKRNKGNCIGLRPGRDLHTKGASWQTAGHYRRGKRRPARSADTPAATCARLAPHKRARGASTILSAGCASIGPSRGPRRPAHSNLRKGWAPSSPGIAGTWPRYGRRAGVGRGGTREEVQAGQDVKGQVKGSQA